MNIFLYPDQSSFESKSYVRIYYRFYGRITDTANTHDPETLATIRKHGDGLRAISGERIWLELKKILTGRHTASIIRVMVECGLAPHIGMLDTMCFVSGKKSSTTHKEICSCPRTS